MQGEDSDSFEITETEAGTRLDQILAGRYRTLKSRTYFQNLIADGKVLLNGKAVKKQLKPDAGDEVEVFFALTPEISLTPENIPLDILFEDEHLIVVDKPAGMVVHPAVGNWSGTFVNALLYHCANLAQDSSSMRPGIVHRLDKDTSGVLIAAKSGLAHQKLVEMFSKRLVSKEYLAICLGNPGEGVLTGAIGRHPVHRKQMAVCDHGRPALTRYRTLHFDGRRSLVQVQLETGRTHQIRVHFSHHRTPILGDSIYGNSQANQKFGAERQMLHARRIGFMHPLEGHPLEFSAKIPADMLAQIPLADPAIGAAHPIEINVVGY